MVSHNYLQIFREMENKKQIMYSSIVSCFEKVPSYLLCQRTQLDLSCQWMAVWSKGYQGEYLLLGTVTFLTVSFIN